MQITLQGKTIDQEAIELIRAYEPPEGYYLGFSGGKDSVVIEHLASRAQVKYRAVYNVSPIDPPPIHQFIKLNYPDVVWENHARGFWGETFIKNGGFPTRRQRWCCRVIKEAGGKGQVRILGTRAAESARRATYPIFNTERQSLYPILYWSNSDVWQYIAEHNLTVSALYRHGFERIGCVLCPFKHKRENELDIQMFPKTVELWRLAGARYWQVRRDRGTPLHQGSPEEYFNWWIDR